MTAKIIPFAPIRPKEPKPYRTALFCNRYKASRAFWIGPEKDDVGCADTTSPVFIQPVDGDEDCA